MSYNNKNQIISSQSLNNPLRYTDPTGYDVGDGSASQIITPVSVFNPPKSIAPTVSAPKEFDYTQMTMIDTSLSDSYFSSINGVVSGEANNGDRMTKEELAYMRKKASARASAYEKAFGNQAHSYMMDKTPILDGIVRTIGYAALGGRSLQTFALKAYNILSVEISSYAAGAVAGGGYGIISSFSGIDPANAYKNFIDNMVDLYK